MVLSVPGLLLVGGVPPAAAPPPPPGTRKASETKIVLLAVVIVVVAIVAGVGALVYVALSTPLQTDGLSQPPAIAATIQATASGVWDATLTVSRSTPLSSFQILVINETSGAVLIPATQLTATFTRSAGGVTASYRDLAGSGQNQMNSGDRIRMEGLVGSNRYSVNLVWRLTGAVLYSFIVPPT